MSERFTFGIPLIARAAAGDWPLVERLLGLTLRSLLAQTDGDFRVLLAAHDMPAPWRALAGDARFVLLPAEWPAQPPTAANDDGGAKKWLVKQRVRADGGGLLMFLDADDWLSRDLVADARARVGPEQAGALVDRGVALDWPSLRVASFPVAGVFDGALSGLCGSTTIARVVPGSDDPLARDPHGVLGSHHEWRARAVALGIPLAPLSARAAYMIGTGQNHSERQGPFAQWRRDLTAAVRRAGEPLDAATAHAFGQDLASLHEGR